MSRRLLLAGVLVAAGGAALAIDLPTAAWCKAGHVPGDLAKALGLAEAFGHGTGVAMLAVAVFLLDPARRAALPRVLVCAYGSGLASDLGKLLVARARPRAADLSGGVLETFVGFLPLARQGSAMQSFPSAHAATAVGLALALAWLYPRGRWYFAALALLVCFQRVASAAHYPSDVCLGAAVGFVVAAACLEGGPLAGWFDRLEGRLAAR